MQQTKNVAGSQIQGGRDYQEDSFGIIDREQLASGEQQFLLLADGMGGHAGGATASRIAIEVFSETYLARQGEVAEKLKLSLDKVTEAIGREIEASPQLKKMGTTLIGAVVTDDGLQWLSVGDSPMWVFRDDELIRLNEDHSMAGVFADLVEMGRMTEEEAKTAPNRNALRAVVGIEECAMVDVSTEPFPLKKGDLLVLASDGLETLSDEDLCGLLKKGRKQPVEELTEGLLQAVEAVGKPGQDNTTVVLYRHGKSEGLFSFGR